MFLTSTRYGLIACRYLAERYLENRYISAPEIAERYNMNVRALMPALRQLTRSGILHSRVGGRQPGFLYAKHPQDISLLDVLSSMEGNSNVPCCKELIPELKCDCESKGQCQVYNLFTGISTELKERLAKVSLAEHARLEIE